MARGLKLSLIFAALMIVGTAASFVVPAPTAGAGVWDDVCCGSGCVKDYCIGDGPYTCCKSDPVET